jgi:hypothetical protein
MKTTQDLVQEFLGDELFFKFQIKFGGLNLYVSRPNRNAVLYFYKKGFSERQIAMKIGASEAFVYNTIKQDRNDRKKQLENEISLWNQK